MTDLSQVREHMEVIGADGVHVGTVDKVEEDGIKLTRRDSGSRKKHHHYLSAGLIADIEDDKVRLSANGDVAVLFEEEKGDEAVGDARLWNWRRIGIGAAAVGVAAAVAAGAGLRQRKRKKEEA